MERMIKILAFSLGESCYSVSLEEGTLGHFVCANWHKLLLPNPSWTFVGVSDKSFDRHNIQKLTIQTKGEDIKGRFVWDKYNGTIRCWAPDGVAIKAHHVYRSEEIAFFKDPSSLNIVPSWYEKEIE